MDIFELAIKREKMMEALYRDLAKKTENTGLKKIMIMLAEEESNHTENFKTIRGENLKLKESNFVADAKIILKGIKEKKDTFGLVTDQLQFYKTVRDSEKESEELYRSEAEKTNDPSLKKVLLSFADEELRHYYIMDEIVQFVEKPDYWVESPEFSNLDRY